MKSNLRRPRRISRSLLWYFINRSLILASFWSLQMLNSKEIKNLMSSGTSQSEHLYVLRWWCKHSRLKQVTGWILWWILLKGFMIEAFKCLIWNQTLLMSQRLGSFDKKILKNSTPACRSESATNSPNHSHSFSSVSHTPPAFPSCT